MDPKRPELFTFSCTSRELIEILEEQVAFKAGLTLTREEIAKHLPEHGDVLCATEGLEVPVAMTRADSILRQLLYRLGALPSPLATLPALRLSARYASDRDTIDIINFMSQVHVECGRHAYEHHPGEPVDLTDIPVKTMLRFGPPGKRLWDEYYALLKEWTEGSIFSAFRRVDWDNDHALQDLFTSAALATSDHGTFVDQRFVNYLAANFEAIDRMHWRKFEGLVGEYFLQRGFAVEVGLGQGDGGIDVRVWKKIPTPGDPASILIQCKRQMDNVGQTVVKALWADLVTEDVKTGLVVTTHRLEPGAVRVAQKLATNRRARGYSVGQVDREQLRKWLFSMRTPWSGVRHL